MRTNTNQEHNATTPANPKKQRPLFKTKEDRSQRSAKQQLTVTGPTGPRTTEGKRRSRYNAATHGIFTLGVLSRESEEEYHQLVNELVESQQPVGQLEEVLVEKLAMLLWRYRRLLRAERAEVESAAASAEERDPESEMAVAHLTSGRRGMIAMSLLTKDEAGLCAACGYLKELRDKIKKEGLDWERDRDTLGLLFGRKQVEERAPTFEEQEQPELNADPIGELAEKYRELAQGKDGKASPGAAQPSPDTGARLITSMIEKQLRLLEPVAQRAYFRQEARRARQAETALVPQQEVADRLQRYEGSLERAFDRTLSQLERLQRMRLGQPVLPPVNVRLSA